MKYRWLISCVASLMLSAVLGTAAAADEAPRMTLKDVPRLSKEDLKAKLGQPDLAVIDVRLPGQLRPGEPKIPGAVIENPREVHNWMPNYPKKKTLVVYCA